MTRVAERDLTIEQVLTMLAGAPPRLAEVTAGLTPAELTIRPAPDAWSVNDVLAHTPLLRRHVGRQHLDDARRGAPDDPRHQPPDVDPRDGLPDRAFRPSLRAYTRQREELLGILERLPPEGWSRDATFAGAGSRWSAPCSPKRSGSLCTNGPI